jgi:hypothetical protein
VFIDCGGFLKDGNVWWMFRTQWFGYFKWVWDFLCVYVPMFERWCSSFRHNRFCIRALIFELFSWGMSERYEWYSCDLSDIIS